MTDNAPAPTPSSASEPPQSFDVPKDALARTPDRLTLAIEEHAGARVVGMQRDRCGCALFHFGTRPPMSTPCSPHALLQASEALGQASKVLGEVRKLLSVAGKHFFAAGDRWLYEQEGAAGSNDSPIIRPPMRNYRR
jgi:hypothetical protein